MMKTGTLTKKQKSAVAFFARKEDLTFEQKSAEQLAQEARKRDALAVAKGEIGYRLSDGTVYAGMFMKRGPLLCAMAEDEARPMTQHDALDHAARLGWRLPGREELAHLFNHRAKIGGFKEEGIEMNCWYWSSAADKSDDLYGHAKNFRTGAEDQDPKNSRFSVRFVRDFKL